MFVFLFRIFTTSVERTVSSFIYRWASNAFPNVSLASRPILWQPARVCCDFIFKMINKYAQHADVWHRVFSFMISTHMFGGSVDRFVYESDATSLTKIKQESEFRFSHIHAINGRWQRNHFSERKMFGFCSLWLELFWHWIWSTNTQFTVLNKIRESYGEVLNREISSQNIQNRSSEWERRWLLVYFYLFEMKSSSFNIHSRKYVPSPSTKPRIDKKKR